MDILEEAEKILKSKMLPEVVIFYNPFNYDVVVTGICFIEKGLYIEYVGRD
jgi:hypothetical protein